MKVDLLKENTWYTVDLLKIKDDALRDKIMEEAGIDPDNVTYQESEDNIEFYGIPAEAVDWDSQEFDEEQLTDTLYELVGKCPHYLVLAKNCRWNGASGLKFCDDVIGTVTRDYEVSIVANKQGKNAILCVESSHDVPTGAPTYIVGLTEAEYNKLSKLSENFDEIEKFVESRF